MYDNETQSWHIRWNHELKKLIQDIIGYIKQQRIKWIGHVWRMPNESTAKKAFTHTPYGNRSREIP